MGLIGSPAPVRRSELVALLSLGTDLGFGQPMEHVIRQCLIALRLADFLEMGQEERVVLYYSGLLAWVGCHTDAYEQAKWFGDDIRLRSDMLVSDYSSKTDMVAFAAKYIGGNGRPLIHRAKIGIEFLGAGRRDFDAIAMNHYLATDQLAASLGLGEDVRASLRESYERWDGRGAFGLKGEQISRASRIVNLADVVEVFERTQGVERALAVARERRGKQFDPAIVDLFCREFEPVFAGLSELETWAAVIDAEPALGKELSDEEFDDACEAIADFADLKSPGTIGHSRAVATLCVEGARILGLAEADVSQLRRAALLHDLGRLGVSNSIWDKRGSLNQAEMERVRLHPYLTERMLSFSPALEPLGAIAIQHHERLDGSGYPNGLTGDAISFPGRILAAADFYHAKTEMRPHREAAPPDEAAAVLKQETSAGKFDPEASAAVLQAAGHAFAVQNSQPQQALAGLTAREIEVLRLLVRGLSNREIAERLVISRKTASNHIEHIYAKSGATNRARASLFALKHGLMSDL